jgi:hypothetical protein
MGAQDRCVSCLSEVCIRHAVLPWIVHSFMAQHVVVVPGVTAEVNPLKEEHGLASMTAASRSAATHMMAASGPTCDFLSTLMHMCNHVGSSDPPCELWACTHGNHLIQNCTVTSNKRIYPCGIERLLHLLRWVQDSVETSQPQAQVRSVSYDSVHLCNLQGESP